MRRKITFIGAGSLVFTKNLVRDILSYPALSDATICLMDINAEKLEQIKIACEHIINAGNYLLNADGVVTSILTNPTEVWGTDITIPMKYGINLNCGDTRGPGGAFRYLRTVEPLMDIAADIARYCPRAIYLNYSNPMAMLCRTIQEEFPELQATGLCHSVQQTARLLANWIGASVNEVEYTCVGINHQAFYTKFEWNGKDAYPLIKAAVKRDEIYRSEIVRCELMKAFGYFVTESSGHNSEYCSWFRRTPELIKKYCNGDGYNPGEYAWILNEVRERDITWKDDVEHWYKNIDLRRGEEYAAYIFNACFGDGTMFKFNGNVRNFGLVDNLPYGACVEVPVLASPKGLEPIHVGAMPPQLALMCSISSQTEEMFVEAYHTGDRELVYQAICQDPLTASMLDLHEIRTMVSEMFEYNEQWLPASFKR